MRLLTFLEYTAIVIGAIAIFAGRHFALANGVHIGIFLVGAGLALGGIESLYSQRMSLRFAEIASYDGIPALAWGAMLLLAGGALIGYAYLLDAGAWPRAATFLQHYPGIVFVAAGLLLVGLSVLLFTDSGAQCKWWQTLLFRAPRVIAALLALTSGVAAMGSGAWQIADPQGYAHAERDVRARVNAALK